MIKSKKNAQISLCTCFVYFQPRFSRPSSPKIFDLTQKSYRNSYRFSNMHTLTSARCVQRFNVSQILQFTLRIAFCCVLHRCESQEIHCQKLFLILFSCYKCFKMDGASKQCPRRLTLIPTVSNSYELRTLASSSFRASTIMIQPQVHLRLPCYDFYFL